MWVLRFENFNFWFILNLPKNYCFQSYNDPPKDIIYLFVLVQQLKRGRKFLYSQYNMLNCVVWYLGLSVWALWGGCRYSLHLCCWQWLKSEEQWVPYWTDPQLCPTHCPDPTEPATCSRPLSWSWPGQTLSGLQQNHRFCKYRVTTGSIYI